MPRLPGWRRRDEDAPVHATHEKTNAWLNGASWAFMFVASKASPIASEIRFRHSRRFVRPELDKSIQPDDGEARYVGQAYRPMSALRG
jgi:hypothetical protein